MTRYAAPARYHSVCWLFVLWFSEPFRGPMHRRELQSVSRRQRSRSSFAYSAGFLPSVMHAVRRTLRTHFLKKGMEDPFWILRTMQDWLRWQASRCRLARPCAANAA